MRPLKSIVPIKGKKGAAKFFKKYGSLIRVKAVGISPVGAPTVDFQRIKEYTFEPYGKVITVEKLPDGIFVNGKEFCKEW